MVSINKLKNKRNFFKIKKFPDRICVNIVNAKLKKLKNFNIRSQNVLKNSLLFIFREKFLGLALDFDGTLIPLQKRDQIIESNILNKLKLLNKKKIPIFILTGRGNSILRQFPFFNFPYKNYIYIAQYNGGKIFLGDKTLISENSIYNFEGYKEIKQFLENNNINYKEKIASFVCLAKPDFINLCSSFISKFDSWRILNTNYSFDIIPNVISKYLALVKGCQYFNIKLLNLVLKIGDAGQLNGNDYDFLKYTNSFSVGTFSSNITTNFPIINENNIALKGPTGLKFILEKTIL